MVADVLIENLRKLRRGWYRRRCHPLFTSRDLQRFYSKSRILVDVHAEPSISIPGIVISVPAVMISAHAPVIIIHIIPVAMVPAVVKSTVMPVPVLRMSLLLQRHGQ